MIPPIIMDAIIFASLLSMLSTGLTLTYMTTKVPNFAHGDFAGLTTYISLMVVEVLGLNPYIGIIPGFLAGGLTALILYLFVLKPLLDRGATYVILMIATIAFDMILFSAINILADYLSNVYKLVTKLFILRSYDFELFG
ncbi:MAG: branched-chain amino acid ABC transporter permease, partial [Thaumarchaeota archaeon]|nr:branched-chain amino acid ABC transporter permease [Nitrososphaerota archaeon]